MKERCVNVRQQERKPCARRWTDRAPVCSRSDDTADVRESKTKREKRRIADETAEREAAAEVRTILQRVTDTASGSETRREPSSHVPESISHDRRTDGKSVDLDRIPPS